MPTDPGPIVQFVNDWGWPIATLVLVILGGSRGWFVHKREFDALIADRDWWRSIATTSLQLGEKAVVQTAQADVGSVEQRLAILEALQQQHHFHRDDG